jgi:diguanylate cyclase (GGDEF)-like protein
MIAVTDRPEEIDLTGIRKALRLLASLRESPAGNVIYRQLESMLEEIASDHLRVEIAYAGFVNSLLDAFASQFTPGSSRLMQVRLLQARLQPPLTVAELNTLSEFVNEFTDQIRTSRHTDTTAFRAAISPLLRAFGIEEPALVTHGPEKAEPANTDTPSHAEPVAAAPMEQAAPAPAEAQYDAEPAGEMTPGEAGSGALTEEAELSAEQDDETGEAGPAALTEEAELFAAEQDDETGEAGSAALTEEAELFAAEQGDETGEAALEEAQDAGGISLGRADKDYHQELEDRQADIRKLQSSLGEQVMETITQNEEFSVILEMVLAELRQTEDVSGIENARWTLIREVEKLLKGHNELADKLDNTHHYLQLVESDSRELTDELSRVRILSLTDELTGLANRRAFMRRLEDEVARVQRYGFPLSFALMDLDHFKNINDEFGHAAGDEVLRVYAKNILSVFRHHDMVARYGGEEFAVLLPNTDADGAIRALNKVRRRAGETRWQSNGIISQVPTFSAGVSLFKPGESATALIERADKALYRAKRLGRDRIELDITYETEEGRRSPRRRSTDL